MAVRNLLSAFMLILFLCSCIKPYIPFVNEPGHDELMRKGQLLYPQMFRQASETEKIGSPAVFLSFIEISGTDNKTFLAAMEESSLLLSSSGFPIAKSEKRSKIKITGKIIVSIDSKNDFGGFYDYVAKCSLKAEESETGREISVFKDTVRGLGLTADDASKAALANAGREAAKSFRKNIVEFYRMKSVVRMEVYNLRTLQNLNDFYLKAKSINLVDNVWLIDYRGDNAYFDVYVKNGGAGNLARGLMEIFGTSIKINRPSVMELEVAVQGK